MVPAAMPMKNHAPTATKKGWIWAIGAVAVVALAAWGVVGRHLGDRDITSSDEPTTKVVRGPITISFTERGSIKAARSEEVYSTLEGSRTIVSVVAEGTFVRKGDLLLELDSSDLTQLYNQQSIAVETSQADLTQADEALKIQESQNESDLKAAELAVDLSGIDFEKYQKGDYPLAVEKAEADIRLTAEELKRAETRHSWTRRLAEKGYVTGTELIADELAKGKAEVQARQAVRAKEVLETYTHKKDLRKSKSDLDQAIRAEGRAQRKAHSQIEQARASLKSKKATHELSLRRLEKIKDQITRTKVAAPQDGMVVYHQDGRYGRDDRIIEQGATVRENQHVMDLPDLSVMAVSLQIPEARINQVKVGLLATATVDAQTQVVLRGRVSKIGILPDYVNRWLNPDLKVYQTEVTVEDGQDTSFLRPGMSAKVEILIEEIPDALYVPVQSVTTIDGETVCFRFDHGAFKPVRVELGASNDTFVVLKSGLAEGETLQLNSPRPAGTPPSQKEREARSLRDLQPGGAVSQETSNDDTHAQSPDGQKRPPREKRGGTDGESGTPKPAATKEGAPTARPAAVPTQSSTPAPL